jgi:hypothetical protein
MEKFEYLEIFFPFDASKPLGNKDRRAPFVAGLSAYGQQGWRLVDHKTEIRRDGNMTNEGYACILERRVVASSPHPGTGTEMDCPAMARPELANQKTGATMSEITENVRTRKKTAEERPAIVDRAVADSSGQVAEKEVAGKK